ncbi:MAG: DEAD/DEAH box helicase [Acidilobaceae archaeon]
MFSEFVMSCKGFEVRTLRPEGYGIYIDQNVAKLLLRDNEKDMTVLLYPEVTFRQQELGYFDLCQVVEEVARQTPLAYVMTRAVKSSKEGKKLLLSKCTQEISIESLLAEVENQLAKRIPGYKTRLGQRRLAELVLERAGRGGLVIARLSTGYGKTTLFGFLARVMSSHGLGGYGLLVSPLRALMRNLYNKSNNLKLKIAYIDSTMSSSERANVLEKMSRGLLDIIAVTPERFLDESFRRAVETNPPSFIAIDEAHVAVEWSLSFRPSYLYLLNYLSQAKTKRLRGVPIVAVSATLARAHAEFLANWLGFSKLYRVSFDDVEKKVNAVFLEGDPLREGLEISVLTVPEDEKRLEVLKVKVEELIAWSRSRRESSIGVIYVNFVERPPAPWLGAKTIAEFLSKSLEVPVVIYHGKMRKKKRKEVEDLIFSSGDNKNLIVVATKAFGMGVDIPHIRWTIHYIPSDSLEDLYQEVGRAGRDGRGARSLIFYNPLDFEIKRKLVVNELFSVLIPLKVYNTAVELAKTGIWKEAVPIPLELTGSRVKTFRVLEKLRESNLIDFTISKARSEGSTETLKFSRCVKGWHSLYPLRVESLNFRVEVGSCESWTSITSNAIALVSIKGEAEKLSAPTLDLLLAVYTEAAWKLSKLSDLQRAIEKALSCENTCFNEVLREYFNRKDLGFIAECRRLLQNRVEIVEVERFEEIANLVKDLMLCLSWRGVTLVSKKRSLVIPLLVALREKLRIEEQPRLISFSRLLKTSQNEIRLSGYGYIVVLTSCRKDIERVRTALSRYPFKTLVFVQR